MTSLSKSTFPNVAGDGTPFGLSVVADTSTKSVAGTRLAFGRFVGVGTDPRVALGSAGAALPAAPESPSTGPM